MITIPVTILDDFLDNPNTVRDWGLSLPFTSSPEGRWPGKRTECISQIDPYYFEYINQKILSLFFENRHNFSCSLHFQLIEDYQGTGWIHQDKNLFTFIIYLSQENEINCGTSIYNLNKNTHSPIDLLNNSQISNLQNLHHLEKNLTPQQQKIKSTYETSSFNKTLDIKDKYNRLLCFSSETFHSANNFSNNDSPRLTLIGFIRKISIENLPVTRSKQTLAM